MAMIWMHHSLHVYKDVAMMSGHNMDALLFAGVQRCGQHVWSQYGCIAVCRCTMMWPSCMVTEWMHHGYQLCFNDIILHGHNMDASYFSALLKCSNYLMYVL